MRTSEVITMKKNLIVMFLLGIVVISTTGCSVNSGTNPDYSLDTKSSHASSTSKDSFSLPISSSDASSESEAIDEDAVRRQAINQKLNGLKQLILDSSIKELNQAYEGDLLCTAGNYELHLRIVGSFSGDTYEFGVFDKSTDSWVVPYSNKYKIVTEFINIQDFLDERHGSVSFYDLGNNIIHIKEFITTWGYDSNEWCYDFLNDRLVKLDDEPVKYYDNRIITGTYSSVAKVYDFQTGETKNFIELPSDLSYKYYVQNTFYNSILIEKAKNGSYGYEFECYQLYDFEGNLLFDLSDYSLPNDHLWKASYNKDKFFFVAKGKDSGIYACLINQDGNLLFDPIKLPDGYDESFNIYLLDDCAVISTTLKKRDNYYGTYTGKAVTNVFYEFDGTEIFRENFNYDE